ncbi:hypothetical protein GCM10010218_19770 [Streptomyces mashuensis]|uniref:Uncharacterized protein n=1 Tax=Streptomyces mashuensis TaxID=33904 RepID=A0A919B0M4_9ACTN|nr:hypothetical protein [Streptomyces mashuensis]GHF38631.1 hypothetical protein GCM10010218_19770 [Streptomyces mashuensis]
MTAATPATEPAAKKEAENRPTSFEHHGLTFTVPAPRKLPVALLEAQDELEAIRLILGVTQWKTYTAHEDSTLEDFPVFADKVAQAAGQADSGN